MSSMSGPAPTSTSCPSSTYIVPRFGHDPFLVGSNYIWGWETNRIAREQVEKAGGAVKGERFVPLGDTGIDHIIAEIAQKRPDFVLNTLIGPSSYAFIEAYRGLGRHDPAFAPENRPIISCNFTEGEAAMLGEKARGRLYHRTLFPDAWTRRTMPASSKGRPGTRRGAAGSRPISPSPIPPCT